MTYKTPQVYAIKKPAKCVYSCSYHFAGYTVRLGIILLLYEENIYSYKSIIIIR